MKALIDTCVVVDALQSREPFFPDAQAVFLLCANRRCNGFITAKAVTDIYYLTHRQVHSDKAAREILTKLFALFGVLDTAAEDIYNSVSAETSDFEDAVMIETAVRSGMDCVVTRNTKDYTKAPLPVYTPAEFVQLLTEPSDEIAE